MTSILGEKSVRDPNTGQFLQEDPLTRFWRKVKISEPDDCWEWQAGKDELGYGMFWLGDRTIHASRALWILLYGPIDGDLAVCHSCDNPACCNPAHLWLGTARDNALDRTVKGRMPKDRNYTNMPKGEHHHNSKLTEDLVRQIRQDYKPGYGNYFLRDTAKKYGVSQNVIWLVVTGRSWRHVK